MKNRLLLLSLLLSPGVQASTEDWKPLYNSAEQQIG